MSVASGLLLEKGGYPLGIRRFQKDLRHLLGLRVPCGSDPLDRSIQVIVAAPQRDTVASQQEPEGSNRLPLIRYPDAASVDNPLGAHAPVELGMGVPAHYKVLIYPDEDLSEAPFCSRRRAWPLWPLLYCRLAPVLVSRRNQSETWAGCIVSLTTITRSSLKASRSVSSRILAEKASRVFIASYFLR